VLLDLMLPKVNGYEICRRARSAQLDLPIIMLTAKGQEDDIIRGLDLGADDYVTKPFSIRELIARVKAFLRRKPSEMATFEFGGCRLDLTAHKLFRRGAEVPLTAKEFRLLEFFMKRAGRALTRDCILDAVWGQEVMVTDRSVDRCVTTLRSKIEPDHETHLCKNDPGYWYRLNCQGNIPRRLSGNIITISNSKSQKTYEQLKLIAATTLLISTVIVCRAAPGTRSLATGEERLKWAPSNYGWSSKSANQLQET